MDIRSTEGGGHSCMLTPTNQQNEIQIDNRWIVPYSPLLSKTYKAHFNVEFCSSVKSIKYICKYLCKYIVHKGSDMAVFAVQNVNPNDEDTRYQMGRYISSNEAVWRILTFPIHERDPAAIHLAVHLDNGQRVAERTVTPPKTTLTEFLHLCQHENNFGLFAKTLLYVEIPTYFTWSK